MARVKIGTKKIVYLLGGFFSLLFVYVLGKDDAHYTKLTAENFVPKEAQADVPYLQSTYYAQSGYGDDDGDGDSSCASCASCSSDSGSDSGCECGTGCGCQCGGDEGE